MMSNNCFENIYDCPCGCHWHNECNCMCDDRCPDCSTSCSPTDSVNLKSTHQLFIVCSKCTPRKKLKDYLESHDKKGAIDYVRKLPKDQFFEEVAVSAKLPVAGRTHWDKVAYTVKQIVELPW